MLISIKISWIWLFLGSDKPRMLFFLFINVKMPTTVGILTFMSRKNFMLSWEKLCNLGPRSGFALILILHLFFPCTTWQQYLQFSSVLWFFSCTPGTDIHLFTSNDNTYLTHVISPRMRQKSHVAVVVVLLFYLNGKHLRSCRDGQLT